MSRVMERLRYEIYAAWCSSLDLVPARFEIWRKTVESIPSAQRIGTARLSE